MSTKILPKSQQPYYGPQADEIRSVIALLTNPENQSLLAAIDAASENGELESSACDCASAAWQRHPERVNPVIELSGTVPSSIGRGLSTLLLKDLVSHSHPDLWGRRRYFAKKHYNYLTKDLQVFLEILSATTPGPERILVFDLMRTGATFKEALLSSRAALIV